MKRGTEGSTGKSLTAGTGRGTLLRACTVVLLFSLGSAAPSRASASCRETPVVRQQGAAHPGTTAAPARRVALDRQATVGRRSGLPGPAAALPAPTDLRIPAAPLSKAVRFPEGRPERIVARSPRGRGPPAPDTRPAPPTLPAAAAVGRRPQPAPPKLDHTAIPDAARPTAVGALRTFPYAREEGR